MLRFTKERFLDISSEMELLIPKFPTFRAKIIESKTKIFDSLLVIYSQKFNLSFWTKPYPSSLHYGFGKDLEIDIDDVNLLRSENLWSKCQQYADKFGYFVTVKQ